NEDFPDRFATTAASSRAATHALVDAVGASAAVPSSPAVENVGAPAVGGAAVSAVTWWGSAPASSALDQASAVTPTQAVAATNGAPTCGNTTPPGDSDWATYQHDIAHTGRSAASIDPGTLNLAWRAPQGYSIPIIVGGSVIAMRNQQGVGSDMTSV